MGESLAADGGGVLRAQPSRSFVVNIHRRGEEAAAPPLKLLCFVSPTPGNVKKGRRHAMVVDLEKPVNPSELASDKANRGKTNSATRFPNATHNSDLTARCQGFRKGDSQCWINKQLPAVF